tara:strand:+ start:227426 stop:227632 length:207 start_codon:yes stop_codon:yes gene_type:complete
MKSTKIDTYIGIIKAEMIAEYIETIDSDFIKEVILRAGGKASQIDEVIKHPSVKEIDENLFYIKTSTS